jgi:hypothetical protein
MMDLPAISSPIAGLRSFQGNPGGLAWAITTGSTSEGSAVHRNPEIGPAGGAGPWKVGSDRVVHRKGGIVQVLSERLAGI